MLRAPRSLLAALLALVWGAGWAADCTVTVDASTTHQTWEGFSASTNSFNDGGVDEIGAMRPQIVDAIYRQVGLTMGDLHCLTYEGATAYPYGNGANDDSDPSTFNWANFNWWRSDAQKSSWYDLANPKGLTNPLLRGGMSTRWADKWLGTIGQNNYNLYLAEAAEDVLAVHVRWRDLYGISTTWCQLFNEPTSGNRELMPYPKGVSTGKAMTDLVTSVGARFRSEGFANIKLAVCSEETEEKSLQSAQAVLSDPVARPYVGAISYHTYPYGSTYSLISNILSTSGMGQPVASRITVRNQIRDLAKTYGLQTWMTEVSNGGANRWDTLRGRAIHIHDEMEYADISSYWGMFQAYESSEEDMVVTYAKAAQTWSITGMGYAIGHYARWIKPGALRLSATSSSTLVQCSVFRDTARGTWAAVLINNNSVPMNLTLTLAGGLTTGSPVQGEQSTSAAYWLALAPLTPASPTTITLSLPAQSITSLGGAQGGAGVAPAITSTPPSIGTVGSAYGYPITTTGSPAATLGVSGKPAWLTLSGSTLSGTPTSAGTFGPITLTASNGTLPNAVQTFSIVVGTAPVAPTITSQPANLSVTIGQTAVFTVAANGWPTPTFQWQRNSANIGGATNANYSTPATVSGDNGATYRCVVTNTVGTVTSASATLTVTASVSVPPTPAAPMVSGAGTATPTLSGTSVAGATIRIYDGSTLIGTVTANGSGAWTFSPRLTPGTHQITTTATNSAGTSPTSPAVSVVIPTTTTPPTITTQPANQSVTIGTTATFSVTATGTPAPTYQWQKDTVAISGATSPAYTTPATVISDFGATYRCVVTNSAGTATSNQATLTVRETSGPRFAAPQSTSSGNCGIGSGIGAVLMMLTRMLVALHRPRRADGE